MDTLFHSMTEQAAYDGQPANLIELTNQAGMRVVLMDIGATWLSCVIPVGDEMREVLLGVSNMADFQRQQSYMGVTVGRYANRIDGGQITLDGTHYSLSINQAGNTLHGGEQGFDKRRWAVTQHTAHQATFTLCSADGDQGFPGNLTVSVTYSLDEMNRLTIRYHATTDKVTPVNLTNHAYFNLDGADRAVGCLDHMLWVDAQYFIPTDATAIPLGALVNVENTAFDFSHPTRIGERLLQDEQQRLAKGYDHSLFFDPKRNVHNAVATVTSSDRQVNLSLFTTKPAMQIYTGNWLAGTPNRTGSEYADYAGFALETQFLPDSPHHPEWPQPSCILRPEETYQYETTYQFKVTEQ